jgi:hypothetical protein
MALATNPAPLPFLWDDTNATSGLAITAVSVLTTELESVTNTSVAGSTVGGSSGVFLNTYFAQAIWADIFYAVGNPGYTGTLSTGANLACWFLTSPDGGTTFENTAVAPARPPDFIIPMPAATSLAANSVFASRNVMLPALEFKILVQNNTGQTMPSGGTTAPSIKIAPVAMQY